MWVVRTVLCNLDMESQLPCYYRLLHLEIYFWNIAIFLLKLCPRCLFGSLFECLRSWMAGNICPPLPPGPSSFLPFLEKESLAVWWAVSVAIQFWICQSTTEVGTVCKCLCAVLLYLKLSVLFHLFPISGWSLRGKLSPKSLNLAFI